jgi:hypothetical protein
MAAFNRYELFAEIIGAVKQKNFSVQAKFHM